MHLSKDFRAKIKSEAAINGMSIIEYSKLLARKPRLLEDNSAEQFQSKIKRGFKFGL
jgi:hypothetical protein